MTCDFTFNHFKAICRTALEQGYEIITLEKFFSGETDNMAKRLVFRIDVDLEIGRLATLADIFRELGINCSVYFRLHAKQYNLLSFANFNLVKRMLAEGHEVGLHSEIVDMARICEEDPSGLLKREISLFREMFGCGLFGVASHGDHTGFNNLDFWKEHDPQEFGLSYEAYDKALWDHSLYVSDSEFSRWKAYRNGRLLEGDHRCACQFLKMDAPLVYLLCHPCSYYHRHFHE